MAKKYYAYFNRYNKEHYDRINMSIPKGYKENIKTAANRLNMSVNEYIFTLICNDLNGVGGTISNQKESFNEEHRELLKKLQVPKKYFEMIADMSYSKEKGYYIYLKEGFINDLSGSRHIYAKTTKEVRVTIGKTHKVGEKLTRQTVKEEIVYDWLSEDDIRQLEKWQVPKKYYPAICALDFQNGSYSIVLQDEYINDSTGTNEVVFKSVSELRTIMKLTHKI